MSSFSLHGLYRCDRRTITPRGPDRAEFARLADPYRRELLEHCYRMIGSVHDAEDLVQETYLRAWRDYPGFEGRASLRTYLDGRGQQSRR
jgi:RNA polymerase sigma-70 factor (ECF subfamily)